ncbi:MAG: DNA-3-methyladenine glycosylase 2 family protein [Candidatus Dormibacteraeota bacterium]|uniref:DNA-3-methyladenine glycosylase II n=1 Tax=Candidatus Amunia macphersoniae TaxID=3127014 RepID=A0A934KCU3_9BACT|nr:DNA-3-methyladenine glycosylase 2 family protein [Candidatus Dormibacteraeota bacterium]
MLSDASPPSVNPPKPRRRLTSPRSIGQHLVRVDPAFATVVRAARPFTPRPPGRDAFNALARAIVYQQLAGRAAAAIHGRFVALFDEDAPTPATVLRLPAGALRGVGLSGAKAGAILDLAAKCTDGTIPMAELPAMADDEVVARLSVVRGVGRWTAEMFLLFDLRRPDVWPVDDYGVRKGWALVHGAEVMPSPRELMRLGDALRPHRSAAAWYCWRAVDTITP